MTPSTGDPIVVDVDAVAGARERERIVVNGLARGTTYDAFVEAIDDEGLVTASPAIAVETGGALCIADDAFDGALTARATEFTVTRPEHLTRLFGCEVIDARLRIVDQECEITQLAALRALREVTGGVSIVGNALCGRGLVDLADLGALEYTSSLQLSNNGVLTTVDLDAAVDAVVVEGNPVLTAVNLSTLARGPGDATFSANPRLSTIAVGIEGQNRGLILADNDILIDIAAPALARGGVVVDGAAILEALDLPALTEATEVRLHDVPVLTSLLMSALTRINDDLVIDQAPVLTRLSVASASPERFVLRNTGLDTVPELTTNSLELIDNVALHTVAAVRATNTIIAHNNPALAPCDVIALAAATDLSNVNIDIDLPATSCPAGTPLLRCFPGGFGSEGEGEGEGEGDPIVLGIPTHVGDEAARSLTMCRDWTGDLVLSDVSTFDTMAGLQVVRGAFQVSSETLVEAWLPVLTRADEVVIVDVPELDTIAMPVLASVQRFVVARAPRWILTDIVDLSTSEMSLTVEDSGIAELEAFFDSGESDAPSAGPHGAHEPAEPRERSVDQRALSR